MLLGSNSKNAAPTTTVGKINGTLTKEINARRPINLKFAITAAIGDAITSTIAVLMNACQVVNHTMFRVVVAESIANESSRSDVEKIFNIGTNTNTSITAIGAIANHLVV